MENITLSSFAATLLQYYDISIWLQLESESRVRQKNCDNEFNKTKKTFPWDIDGGKFCLKKFSLSVVRQH